MDSSMDDDDVEFISSSPIKRRRTHDNDTEMKKENQFLKDRLAEAQQLNANTTERLGELIATAGKLPKKRKPVPRGGLPGLAKGPDICRRCIIKGGVWEDPSALWGLANAVLEEIANAWSGDEYNEDLQNIAKANAFDERMKNFTKEQKTLAPEVRFTNQMDKLIALVQFQAMMCALDVSIPSYTHKHIFAH
ncbi:hypothetical protein MMC07_001743 [Pseudocyphellaria aurata]|nr:hypothetical protein [Pseudocyphellaria aurata]